MCQFKGYPMRGDGFAPNTPSSGSRKNPSPRKIDQLLIEIGAILKTYRIIIILYKKSVY
jgi:hypothetical protein